jgi:hypothetical protein
MAYFTLMRFSRLLSILALFAVLLAPAGMLGNHAAMAMPAPQSGSGHCSEQQQPSGQDQQAMIDCAIACTALPPHQPVSVESALDPAAAPEAAITLFTDGATPETTTPPPRFS